MSESFNYPDRQSSRSLWSGFLVGPVVWAVHFLAVYIIAEGACMGGNIIFPIIDSSIIYIYVGIITLAALAIVLWKGIVSYRLWRSHPSERQGGQAVLNWYAEEKTPFMAMTGFLLSLFFSIVILLTVIPFLFLTPCGGAFI